MRVTASAGGTGVGTGGIGVEALATGAERWQSGGLGTGAGGPLPGSLILRRPVWHCPGLSGLAAAGPERPRPLGHRTSEGSKEKKQKHLKEDTGAVIQGVGERRDGIMNCLMA